MNLLTNQDIYLIKQSCILVKKNLRSQVLVSRLNPVGVLDFSPLYFLAKEKYHCKVTRSLIIIIDSE